MRGAVVKATVMRQTLHLVTVRDYALIRSAMSELSYPWETPLAKRLAPVVRTLATAGPVTSAEAISALEGHDLGGLSPRRAFRYARAAAHLVHHPETALWNARPEGRFVAIDEPEVPDPTESRAEMLCPFGRLARADRAALAEEAAQLVCRLRLVQRWLCRGSRSSAAP